MSIYDISVTKADGSVYDLEEYRGTAMLIVNTATNCGLKGQFDSLESLYQQYKVKGFVVLGFPSNQFKQELDNAGEAEQSCRLNYGVTFPMHELVKVNGKEAPPLFQYITEQRKGTFGRSIKWNFTKFLVDKEGNVLQRFAPQAAPESFEAEIRNIL
ncbi:glutathione peroxidase [Salibacterium aidingense]|uniref:glutathione peroxidase n=1 Tax=Salibacterium aidingense TaxID=384933 RepID=UPI003BDBC588